MKHEPSVKLTKGFDAEKTARHADLVRQIDAAVGNPDLKQVLEGQLEALREEMGLKEEPYDPGEITPDDRAHERGGAGWKGGSGGPGY